MCICTYGETPVLMTAQTQPRLGCPLLLTKYSLGFPHLGGAPSALSDKTLFQSCEDSGFDIESSLPSCRSLDSVWVEVRLFFGMACVRSTDELRAKWKLFTSPTTTRQSPRWRDREDLNSINTLIHSWKLILYIWNVGRWFSGFR